MSGQALWSMLSILTSSSGKVSAFGAKFNPILGQTNFTSPKMSNITTIFSVFFLGGWRVFFFFFLRVALTGPRSVARNRLHPCSHWPLNSFMNTGIFEEDP